MKFLLNTIFLKINKCTKLMLEIKDILHRFNSDWEKLIGLPAWNAILSELGNGIELDCIANIVLEMTDGGRTILSDKVKRNAFFSKLREVEARNLVSILGLDGGINPYAALRKARFTEEKKVILFGFFGLDYSVP